MNETKPIGECYECHKPLYATLGLCEVCELKDEIDRLNEECQSLLESGTVLANARLELLSEIQQLKEKPTTWLCENCESKKADIRNLKDLLQYWLSYIDSDEEIKPPITETREALAAQPQKGEK